MHKLLRRQLRRLGLNREGPWSEAEVATLLAAIGDTYEAADADRYLLERSLDISSREMAELYADLAARSKDALQTERDKLRAVLATLHDGLAAYGAGTEPMFINDAMRELVGDDDPNAVIADGVTLDDGSKLAERVREVLSTGRRWVGGGRAGPNERPVAIIVAPSRAGELHDLVLVSVRDISIEREAEEQLTLALGAAREAVEARERFLAVMSHEIRTPMNGVIGAAGLLLTTSLGERQEDYVRTIRKSGEVLLALINDVLDFSKLDADRLQLERSPFDPATVIEEVVDLVAHTAFEKGLDVGVVGTEALPDRIHGDAGRVRQIVLNLLTNAVKFTSEGAIRIDTRYQGGVWTIDVVDTGIGIPADAIDGLFEPFRQADASTTRRFGGTGLGLAICRRLADAMGGNVTVLSTHGQGTCFRVSLPLPEIAGRDPMAPFDRNASVWVIAPPSIAVEAIERMLGRWGLHLWSTGTPATAGSRLDDPEYRQPSALIVDARADAEALVAGLHEREIPVLVLRAPDRSEPAWTKSERNIRLSRPPRRHQLQDALAIAWDVPRPPPSQGRGVRVALDALRILVAEDNAVNQMVARRMLEHFGCACDVVGDGAEAVAAVRAGAFDVVLMDLQMPVRDGLEATADIRSDPMIEQPRIIAMTANVMAEDIERCRAAGMDGYLAKPVTMAALASALTSPSRWREPD